MGRPDIVVVGGGVSGLSCAYELALAGKRVEVWTAVPPEATTSRVAAAFWHPYRADPIERVGPWASVSYERFAEIAADDALAREAGVEMREAIELFERARPNPPWSRYVVVHPGASAPARTWAPEHSAALVDLLVDAGYGVVVTGSADERELTARVAGRSRALVHDLNGRVDFAGLADVLAGADAVVVGNTGPAHLAAAVGTPVVSLFPPTVPAVRWRPWGVRHVLLGEQTIACRGCRARLCPVAGHPCIDRVSPADVLAAIRAVTARTDLSHDTAVGANV